MKNLEFAGRPWILRGKPLFMKDKRESDARHQEAALDTGLDGTFPASDPVAVDVPKPAMLDQRKWGWKRLLP